MNTHQRNTDAGGATAPWRARGPLGRLIDLFSSIWLGITLLTLLFVYSSVGSAGAPIGPGVLEPPFILRPDAWVAVRQLPALEMTEFEWFHWWPFKLLMGLICTNLVVATLRRIPLNVVNLGVWMIHTGIIMLSLSCVWYFGTKVEGDTPVARRGVLIEIEGHEPVRIVATPGASAVIGTGESAYAFVVRGIDPAWELLSGDDQGVRAYAVNVGVQSNEHTFTRQLIAGFPQYTEDVVATGDPAQPMARARRVFGTALVDEAIKLSLVYEPQPHLYLMQSAAIYLREHGASEWVRRPVEGLPRYNDRIAAVDDVWLAAGDELEPSPVRVRVPPVGPDDPLPGTELTVSRYLRYAHMESRRMPGGTQLDPTASVRLDADDGSKDAYQLIAFDPQGRSAENGLLQMYWVDSAEALDQLKRIARPVLTINVSEPPVKLDIPISDVTARNPDLEFTEIDGTAYAYRVEAVEDNLNIAGRVVSLAKVEIRKGEEVFRRWVFDDPALNRDLPVVGDTGTHGETRGFDAGIEMAYTPGHRPAPVAVVAGPEEESLGILTALDPAATEATYEPVQVGQRLTFYPENHITVTRYAARTRTDIRPFVVPRGQRDRDVAEMSSMIKVDVPEGPGHGVWLPYHHYAFDREADVLRRFPYRPSVLELSDGRRIELLFSRDRMDLPAPVVLEDFEVTAHIGGFSGSTSSIRDWTSRIRFSDSGKWTEPLSVSMNAPAEHRGFWFFQAQWDPPDPARFEGDPGSAGLNYTVLGVGNRNGVQAMLVGCCIAVIGMLYAFYVKPFIRRRRQVAVYARVAAQQAEVNGAPVPGKRSAAIDAPQRMTVEDRR